jgi:AcrR family transcriptional regulator
MGKADETRERILAAAMAEFSAYGIAGARVDRIAQAAGCNKNLIYVYFESKENLFTTVLQQNLLRVYEELTFTPDDLPGYATRVFDFAMDQPELMRLMAWSNLEHRVATPTARTAARDEKVAEMTSAQESGQLGTAFPPAFLMTAIMSLATAWTAANPFGFSLDPDAVKNPAELRQSVANAVALLAKSNAVTS